MNEPGLRCHKCGLRGTDVEPIPDPEHERFRCRDYTACKRRAQWLKWKRPKSTR